MRVLVVGAGSIGQRHIRNLIALGHEVCVEDIDGDAMARAVGAQMCIYGRLDHDAVIDATPVGSHRLRQCPLPHLVEKPLSTDTPSAYSAFRCDDGHRPLIQVGYQFRFDAGIADLRSTISAWDFPAFARITFSQRLDEWQSGRDYRTTPYAKTGILLEASHELDLIRFLFGEWTEVTALVGQRSDLEIDVEDTAFALLRMQTGMLVELHLDMVASGYERGITVTHRDGRQARWTFAPSNDLYMEEMRAFLRSVESGVLDPHAATFYDGIAALELVEAIREASESGRTVERRVAVV